jgi:hypothetical protein
MACQCNIAIGGDVFVESLYSDLSSIRSDNGDVVIGDAHGEIEAHASKGLAYFGE